MTADYSKWRAALRGEGLRDYVRGVHPGFFRVRYGAEDKWHPLATFELGGEIVGLFLSEIYTADELTDELQIWPKAARHPVPEADYRAVAEQGQEWPKRKPNAK